MNINTATEIRPTETFEQNTATHSIEKVCQSVTGSWSHLHDVIPPSLYDDYPVSHIYMGLME